MMTAWLVTCAGSIVEMTGRVHGRELLSHLIVPAFLPIGAILTVVFVPQSRAVRQVVAKRYGDARLL